MSVLLALFGSISLRGWLLIGSLVTVVGGGFWLAHYLEERGAERLRTQIDNQDRSAVNAAELARNRRRACVDGGGVWDTSTGQCGQR